MVAQHGWKVIVAALLGLSALAGQKALETPVVVSDRVPGLTRGMNILGYDPIWIDPSKARFKKSDFAFIRNGGFDFVRVNLAVFPHVSEDNQLDPAWLDRLDWVVDNAKSAGLKIILDVHDVGKCKAQRATCRETLKAVWRQLGERYRREPSSVLFELLNEPGTAFDEPAWNSVLADLLTIVRSTNPDRMVVIAASRWKDKSKPPKLQLPASDRRIIYTFHYYRPIEFTHQGVPWGSGRRRNDVTWGTPSDHAVMEKHFNDIARWARANGRPVLLGEFGVYDKSGVPVELRADYAGAAACAAERHGFGWAYWQFDHDFVAWDRNTRDWVKPVKEALIPGRNGAGPKRPCT